MHHFEPVNPMLLLPASRAADPCSLSTCLVVQDDLRPISCTGTNSQGGLALTLVDALDTLVVR